MYSETVEEKKIISIVANYQDRRPCVGEKWQKHFLLKHQATV